MTADQSPGHSVIRLGWAEVTADSSLYALGQKVTAGPSSTYNVIRLGLVKETTGPSLRHITIALGQKVIAGPLSTCNVLSHGWAEVTADLTPKHITISPGGHNVTTGPLPRHTIRLGCKRGQLTHHPNTGLYIQGGQSRQWAHDPDIALYTWGTLNASPGSKGWASLGDNKPIMIHPGGQKVKAGPIICTYCYMSG